MKKLLLSLTAMALLSVATAQQRLSLYEEFSGENCGPCAAANPGLWAKMVANPTKIFLIKYQSPIPTAGPIYNLYPNDYQNRGPYYNVPFAPYGRLNGTGLGTGTAAPTSPGHVANLTQADIDNAYAIPSPFNITATHSWNATGDQVNAAIQVNCVSNFAPSGAQLKLRVALVETLVYDSPPGTNGETEFHNVVRRMYPDGSGTSIPNSWTASQSQTFNISGFVPAYVDKADSHTFLVVWIQDDNGKAIAQAATSTFVPLTLDVASQSLNIPQTLFCTAGNASVTPSVTIKNTGTTPLTSATIWYKVDAGGTWTSAPWTGSLAANATANVTLPAISLTPGRHVIYDSVAMPNNMADINPANNKDQSQVWVQNTAPNALPLSTGFENGGSMPNNYMLYDVNGNAQNWVLAQGSSSAIGHGNSTYLIYHDNYNFPDNEANLAILPTPDMPAGAKALDFWIAHARYNNTYNDKLEVVYSTNCGSSWTTVWTKLGSDLVTAPNTTNPFVPTQSQWKLVSVDMTAVPTGAMIALRATSNYGNRMFVDDINLRAGATAGIEEVMEGGYVQVYPNPARDHVTIEFTLHETANVQVVVTDAAGRIVSHTDKGSLNAGVHNLGMSTSAFAAGLYYIRIQTEHGSHIEKLTIVK